MPRTESKDIPRCILIRKVNSQPSLNRVSYRKSIGQGNPVFPDATRRIPSNPVKTRLQMSKDEEVLVIPAQLLDKLGPFSGFQPNVDRYLSTILDRSNQSFRPRSLVETDPSFKQLIPYVILECNDAMGTRVFQYTRGKGQGEKRLHALRSIGIGGHISVEDATGDDWYRTGMQRELEEEVCIECNGQQRIVGLIYDNSTEVGRVHLGIVHIMQLSSCKVQTREDHLEDSGFQSVETIKSELNRLENWSQLCINHLYS
ncbi:MAG TPA: phosphoesterase [Pirellula sp.]|nr:phosphoesterase [Pirellula sp.]